MYVVCLVLCCYFSFIMTVKCRKCRFVLLTHEQVKDVNCCQKISNTCDEVSECDNISNTNSLWFVNEDDIPYWICEELDKSRWTKGRLCCPKCSWKVGGFDFICLTVCSCNDHVLPAIHITKTRVDTTLQNPLITPAKFVPIQQSVTLQDVASLQPLSMEKQESLAVFTPSKSNTSSPVETTMSVNQQHPLNAIILCPDDPSGPVIIKKDNSCAFVKTHNDPQQQHIHSAVSCGKKELTQDNMSDACINDEEITKRMTHGMENSKNCRQHNSDDLEDQTSSVVDGDEDDHGTNVLTNQNLFVPLFLSGLVDSQNQESSESETSSLPPLTEIDIDRDHGNTLSKHLKYRSRKKTRHLKKRYSQLSSLDGECVENRCGSDNPVNLKFDLKEKSTKEPPDDLICAICLDLYCRPHRCNPCTHIFCETCLRQVAEPDRSNTFCPLCRTLIYMCTLDEDVESEIISMHPEEYKARQKSERLKRSKLRNKMLPYVPAPYRVKEWLLNQRTDSQRRIQEYKTTAHILLFLFFACMLGQLLISAVE